MNIERADIQFINDRLFQTFYRSFFRTDNILHDNLILTFLKPATRHIQRLLRTDFPEASYCMSVDIDLTLAPSFQIKERIAGFLQIECSTIAARNLLILQSHIFHVFLSLIAVTKIVYLPILEVDSHLAAIIHGISQFHFFCNTLEVFNGTSEIDTTHGFHEDINLIALFQSRHQERLLMITAVE